jgi:uncharacterized membrane protein
MQEPEIWLTRWQDAGLLDAPTAAAIRAYEQAHAQPASRRWQVRIALIVGTILLGSGILLFVAAHWDTVSPLVRMLLVLAMLCFFHVLGLLVRTRFAGFATAMHAAGTLAAGAAIALVGQIFNIQEHWPAGVMLWALCAAAGWALLRDPFQQSLTLLLTPAWIACEWLERAGNHGGVATYLARFLALIGVTYLTAFLQNRRAVFYTLFSAGALLLPVTVVLLAQGWSDAEYRQALPLSFRLCAWTLALLAIAAGCLLNRKSWAPLLVVAGLVSALPWAQTTIAGKIGTNTWRHSEPNLLAYGMVAATAIFLVWWGVHVLSRPVVNFGIAAFALTVTWFYFANVMNKLDRSLGLIVLGILFLAGGWALEHTRRRLVASMAGTA